MWAVSSLVIIKIFVATYRIIIDLALLLLRVRWSLILRKVVIVVVTALVAGVTVPVAQRSGLGIASGIVVDKFVSMNWPTLTVVSMSILRLSLELFRVAKQIMGSTSTVCVTPFYSRICRWR